jgi:hypothetical protein
LLAPQALPHPSHLIWSALVAAWPGLAWLQVIREAMAGGSETARAQLLGSCEEVIELLCLAAHHNDLPWLNMLLKAGADATQVGLTACHWSMLVACHCRG